MFQLKRSVRISYEDLMRELEVIERKLLTENSSLAMDLMVVEAKIRERFQHVERMADFDAAHNSGPGMSLEDLKDLIPRDMPPFPSMREIQATRPRNKMWETVFTAALLAVFTALGVFGLASVLQIGLTWLA